MQPLLPIALGAAAGWMLAKALLGIRKNPEDDEWYVDFAVPEWVQAKVKPVHGNKDLFVIHIGGEEAGVIIRLGHVWDAYARVDETRRAMVEESTTRKRAISAVYATAVLLDDIRGATTSGRLQQYPIRKFVKLPPKKRGQVPREVERFYRKDYPVLRSESEISSKTGIPVDEVIRYAQKLAEMRIIYGLVAKERIGTFERIKTVPERMAYKHGRYEPRKRRIVAAVDIKKMRKSPMLSAEEKKELPRVRHVRVYKFALLGPRGEVGFYEAD